ncbi:MAG: hypothetical protein K8T26_11750 [Lentisphaerae bacterium]|nr:hypothetical protein [Lentisphaerota bacterium]
MDWTLPASERTYLRELAYRQAAYAALPIMEQRKRQWYAHNDGQAGTRPPVVIETWTFDRDFLPASLFHCTTETGREIERHLLRHIRNHELIDDDKVIPDTFDVGWYTRTNQLGVNVAREEIKDSQGVETGYHFIHPITNLARDLALVSPVDCRVDRPATLARKAFLDDLLGDILPVRIQSGKIAWTGLTSMIIRLMGMEAFFIAMYDTPDLVHQLMVRLRDNALAVMRWAEAEGLLQVNNGNEESFGSSYNFTTRLPAADYAGGPARMKDMWGSSESQETVGISPDMFGEFCAPYYRDVCEPFGLLYWGCCEPAHPLWEHISRMPHLKKVSISRWCDQRFMGEALRGTDIVFSRKPDPRFIGVDVALNEDAWATHVRETLEATRDVFVEFIYRDVYTVHGDLDKVRRAVAIARREIERAGRG